jgi:tripartite-type tricarboxylate transporter receptor subunit TctC
MLHQMIGAFALCALASQAQAQTFPDRPIRLIVPYAPGGITDITARILGPRLGEELGQQVVVDNRPGGAGMIGIGMAARAPADGHTLLVATTALAANPILFKDIPYDARKDFTPISLVGLVPMVLVVPPSSPATTIAELVALARSKPGELNYGSAGNGSDNHLTAELFNHLAGIRATHIPYRGGGQVMTDLIAGRVAYVFATLPTALPFIGEGRLRGMATTGQARSPDLAAGADGGGDGAPRLRALCMAGPARPRRNSPSRPRSPQHRDCRDLAAPGNGGAAAHHRPRDQGGTPQDMSAHLARELNRWSELARHVRFEVAN